MAIHNNLYRYVAALFPWILYAKADQKIILRNFAVDLVAMKFYYDRIPLKISSQNLALRQNLTEI